MSKVAKAQSSSKDSTFNLGFETNLWMNAETNSNKGSNGQDQSPRRERRLGLAKRARKEMHATSRHPAIMNLTIQGIEAENGKEHSDSFRNVPHPRNAARHAAAAAAKR